MRVEGVKTPALLVAEMFHEASIRSDF